MATPVAGGVAPGLANWQGLPAYAELHCRSNFSFLVGASHPEELVARAHELSYTALALTDECSLAGVVRAHAEAKRLKLHLIVGAEMHLAPSADGGAPGPRLVVLAQTRRGYGNLAQWITVARRRSTKGSYLAQASDVEGRVPHAPYLAGLPDCLALLVVDAALPFETQFAHATPSASRSRSGWARSPACRWWPPAMC